jgi:hypothetical protein
LAGALGVAFCVLLPPAAFGVVFEGVLLAGVFAGVLVVGVAGVVLAGGVLVVGAVLVGGAKTAAAAVAGNASASDATAHRRILYASEWMRDGGWIVILRCRENSAERVFWVALPDCCWQSWPDAMPDRVVHAQTVEWPRAA